MKKGESNQFYFVTWVKLFSFTEPQKNRAIFIYFTKLLLDILEIMNVKKRTKGLCVCVCVCKRTLYEVGA